MHTLCYKIQSHRFSIQVDDDKLLNMFYRIYPGARYDGNGKTDITYVLKTTSGDATKEYEIFENGIRKYNTHRKSKLISRLEWLITCNALSHLQEFFQLHAGGVVKDGKAILFSADHGCGKTTLVMDLIQNGYHCLADDIILLDPGSLFLYSFPRCFSVKGAGTKLLNETNVTKKDHGFYSKPKNILYFNPYAIDGCVVEKAGPYAIIELEYNQNHRNELKPLSKPQMCMTLLEQSFNIDMYKRKGVSILTELLRKCKCYSLKINNLKDANNLISQIWEEPSK